MSVAEVSQLGKLRSPGYTSRACADSDLKRITRCRMNTGRMAAGYSSTRRY
jgi:hypothetical protein